MKKFYLFFLLLTTFILNNAIALSKNPPCNVHAGFTTGYVNNQLNVVQCFNTSTVDSGSVVYSVWNFGDGTAPVNTQGLTQPTHTYTASGLYYICLQVISVVPGTTTITCGDSICHSVQVQAPSTCTLVANFTSTATSSPMSFIFQNTSTGYAAGDSIRWSFGDGSVSYDANPTHTYANYGTYNVCLRVKKNPTPAGATPCVSEICHTITIANPNPCTLVPALTVVPSPNATNAYVFTNTSTPAPSTATWNFGDSTSGSGNVITHSYAQSGVYRVCMTVIVNNTCVRDTCFNLVVNNTPPPTNCNVHAAFSTSYVNNQLNVVQCLNASVVDSINTVYCIWNFGDGSTPVTNSGLSQPTHTYTASGLYNICLKVISLVPGTNINCSDSICHQVQVQAPTTCTLVSNFTSSVSSNTASFVNTSTGYAAGDSIRWTFGDGSVAYSLNATHTYAANGTYNVCLRIKKNSTPSGTTPCVSEVCHTITITTANICNVIPNFTAALSPNTGNVFVFTNTSTPSTSQAAVTWNFGDSTFGSGNVVTHSYAQPGVYRVCMTVVVNNTCVRDTCITITVNNITPPPCSVIPRFTITASQSQPGLYFFTNTSTVSTTTGTSVVWSFGDSTTATGNNVSHTYTHSGTYNVCMNVFQDSTCNISLCRNLSTANYLLAFPNPAQTNVNVNINLSQSTPIYAYIYNSQGMLVGQLLQQGIQGNNLLTFNVAGLPAGYYTIRIYTSNGVFITRFQKI